MPTKADRLFEEVTARLPNGRTVPFWVHQTDQHVSPAIRGTGRWEPFATSIVWSLLEPGDGVIDIGANIGWYSMVCAHAVGPRGWVHAFEPDPVNGELLRHNVTSDLTGAPVTVHQVALADQNGSMQLSLSEANLGDHRLAPLDGVANGRPHQRRHDVRQSVEVPVRRLDDVLTEHAVDLSRLRVVKIDTQGAEVLILRGAPALLRGLSARTALLIEFAPNLLRAHGPEHVDAFIATVMGLGRTIYTLRRASMVATDERRLRRLAAKLAPLGDEWAVDLLVVPDVRADSLRVQRFRPPRPTAWI